MEQIALDRDPNKSFRYTYQNVTYQITLSLGTGKNCLYNISVNNELVGSGIALPGKFLIKYNYHQYGNLFFLDYTDENNYPYYENFGITQFLFVLSQDEVNEIIL